ncbi:LLM class flavin-dependent oxidoreductase [Frankia sp. CiP3]|uniref:LLM class flavin-dependent oxidoreductase n=1 Tax=Frankia sp. CiP3 TaxID=2880971 RepID=UPI001EF60BFD|nr:LLM class flavin-dependent oxidoreductase [Frankia sp. CiP3]
MTTDMRFGLPGGRGDLETGGPTSATELGRTAEALGFDSLWFTDGHLTSVGSRTLRARPAPIPLAAAVASATSRIRLGFTALHVTQYDPIRLAADLATLDRLSGGRVILGVGWPAADYSRVTRCPGGDADLSEALDTVLRYWRGCSVVADGARYRVGPTPVQYPHPPVEVAAHTDESVVWAASRGYGLLIAATGTTRSMAAQAALFVSRGGSTANLRVERFCLVARTDAEAEQIARPVVKRLTGRLASLGGDEHGYRMAGPPELDPVRFLCETAIVGGPETVARRLAALRDEMGIEQVNIRPSFSGTVPLRVQQNSVRLFASEVVPIIRGLPTRQAAYW